MGARGGSGVVVAALIGVGLACGPKFYQGANPKTAPADWRRIELHGKIRSDGQTFALKDVHTRRGDSSWSSVWSFTPDTKGVPAVVVIAVPPAVTDVRLTYRNYGTSEVLKHVLALGKATRQLCEVHLRNSSATRCRSSRPQQRVAHTPRRNASGGAWQRSSSKLGYSFDVPPGWTPAARNQHNQRAQQYVEPASSAALPASIYLELGKRRTLNQRVVSQISRKLASDFGRRVEGFQIITAEMKRYRPADAAHLVGTFRVNGHAVVLEQIILAHSRGTLLVSCTMPARERDAVSAMCARVANSVSFGDDAPAPQIADKNPNGARKPVSATSARRCGLNSDCATKETCAAGRCVLACRQDRDCADGQRCTTDRHGQAVCAGNTATRPSDPEACENEWRCAAHIRILERDAKSPEQLAEVRAMKSKLRSLVVTTCETKHRSCEKAFTMVRNGVGGPRDPARADQLENIHCDALGSDNCWKTLGSRYAGAKNDRRVAELAKVACKMIRPDICATGGESYLRGRGVARDPAVAGELFRKGCSGIVVKDTLLRSRGAVACVEAGKLALAEKGNDASRKAGLRYLWYGCERGNDDGCLLLAHHKLSGARDPAEVEGAADLLARVCPRSPRQCAAARKAYFRAAEMYLRARNTSKAAHALQAICHPPAPNQKRLALDTAGCAQLAVFVEHGYQGQAADRKEATRLARLGCEGGDKEACKLFARLDKAGAGAARKQQQAAERRARASCTKDTSTCSEWALGFLSGEFGPPKPDKAFSILKKYCTRGVESSCDELGELCTLDRPECKGAVKLLDGQCKRGVRDACRAVEDICSERRDPACP